ncbi:hypothetical protein PVNG_06029 [Plasmodium vivax North Korean]|uniref:Uncharacterized protein n=1 Tax=Plasmodium vivax North Korean TaxID=1035514 RepID=A0A0J9W6G5_PLAVI|nr:hypothetical protein PVNG_06029 [Plasmodium vivax North Korean]
MKQIYTYVDQFPDLASKIHESGNVTDGTNKQNCEAFKNSKLSTHDGKEKDFINKCTKIVNYNDKVAVEESSKTAYFEYINYWLYDRLNDVNQFSHKELLDDFYNKIEKFSNCKTYKKYINEEIYNELNELYKLHEHLFKYKKGLTESSSDYCVHAKEGAELYESRASKCKWNSYDYCSSLKQFRDEYEKYRSTDTKCSDHMQYLTPVGYNPEAYFLNATLAMSIITFVFIYFYKVCNYTILKIF